MATRRSGGTTKRVAAAGDAAVEDALRKAMDAPEVVDPPARASRGGSTLTETLANAPDMGEVFRSLMASAGLTADQQAVLDLILAIPDDDESKTAAQLFGEGDDEDLHDGPEAIRALQQELIDLRHVNDTVAAALGACPSCWGGDSSCGACHGRGGAGYAAPDLDLFARWVVPATERVRSLSRTRRPAAQTSVRW
jgi:hypothetical protein